MELSRGRGTGTPQHELAEQVFDALVGDTAVGFAVLDAELRYLTVNERLARINGVPVEKHLGRRLADVLPHFARWPRPPSARSCAPAAPCPTCSSRVRAGHRRRPAALARERLPRPGPRRGRHRRGRARVGGHRPGGVPAAPRPDARAARRAHRAGADRHRLPRPPAAVRAHQRGARRRQRQERRRAPGQAAARGDPRDRRRHRSPPGRRPRSPPWPSSCRRARGSSCRCSCGGGPSACSAW